ncbi:MAG: hypothetical protein O2895_00775 [Chloroflexi bacterium]|nr:hypothetical protein [Chloroflexota bacterium]
MSREASTVGAVALIALVVVAVLAIGLGGVRSSIEVRPALPETEADAAVVELIESGGLSVLGLRLRSPTYRVRVRLFAPEACLARIDGGLLWPAAHEDCRSDVPIDGVVAGEGRLATGETIVVVEREISRACYEALTASLGASWPVPAEACAAY